jgi:hypothetical protein
MATLVANYSFLLSGDNASGAGSVILDNRRSLNYGLLLYATYSPSAVLSLQASHDGTGWLNVLTVTGTPTSGTAQVSAYYPYLRGVKVTGWSTTASAIMFWAGGLNSTLG